MIHFAYTKVNTDDILCRCQGVHYFAGARVNTDDTVCRH